MDFVKRGGDVEFSERRRAGFWGGVLEQFLSLFVLESLLPIGGCEVEDTRFRPVGEEVEEVAEVVPRLHIVQLAAGNEGNEDGVGKGSFFGPDEDPIFPSDSLPSQVSFGDVVGHGESTVVEESLESFSLVDSVTNSRGNWRVIEDEISLCFAPGEEIMNDGARLLIADSFFSLTRLSRDGPLDLEQRRDVSESEPCSVGVGGEGFEEVAAAVRSAADLDDLSFVVEVVVDDVCVGNEIATVTREEFTGSGGVMALQELERTYLSGAMSTQKRTFLQRSGACTSTPVASVHK